MLSNYRLCKIKSFVGPAHRKSDFLHRKGKGKGERKALIERKVQPVQRGECLGQRVTEDCKVSGGKCDRKTPG